MKLMRRPLALVLALLLLAVPTLAAPLTVGDFIPFTDAVSCAIYMVEQYESGVDTFNIRLPGGTSMQAQVEAIFFYIRMQLAEYYLLTHSISPSGPYAVLTISMDGREGQRMEAKAKAKAVVSEIIEPTMTTREKLLALHDYVVDNCVYDTKAAWNKDHAAASVFTAYGMLIDGKAVCDGYSAAFALLCRYAGIPCIQMFNPTMDGAGHSWNAVLLGGQVLFVDTTFDDPDWLERDHAYFLLTAQELQALGHSWDEALVTRMLTALWDRDFRAAYDLSLLGLFKGSDTGLELSRAPYRSEASIMLLRLMGLEQEALTQGAVLNCPFDDVSAFYAPYVAFLFENGLTQGTSETTFSPETPVDLRQYMTFVLRAMGYDDRAGDFDWTASVDMGISLGILTREEAEEIMLSPFDRGHMAYISLGALFAQTKAGGRLIDRLTEWGLISPESLAEIENNS